MHTVNFILSQNVHNAALERPEWDRQAVQWLPLMGLAERQRLTESLHSDINFLGV